MSMLDQLIEMGFSQELAKKALEVTSEKSLEDALDWLETHGKDDGSTAQPTVMEVDEEPDKNAENKAEVNQEATTAPEDPLAKSPEEKGGENEEAETSTSKEITFKCNQCGKLLKGELEVMFHAGKTQHDVFSESTEQIKALTKEEKEQKMVEMREKIKVAMAKKEEKQRQDAIDKEKKRRMDGQARAEMMERRKEIEIKELAEQRKRDKQEEQEAKRRVLEQIRHDREARKAAMEPKPAVPAPAPAPVPLKTTPQQGEFCNLQIRLPDGSVMKEKFKSTETLAAVRLWVELNRKDPVTYHYPFTLMVPFPRQMFTAEDMETPLQALGLVPSACLVVARAPSA